MITDNQKNYIKECQKYIEMYMDGAIMYWELVSKLFHLANEQTNHSDYLTEIDLIDKE